LSTATCTNSSGAPAAVDLDAMVREIEKLLANEPWAKFMTENGTPPSEWVLFIPSKLFDQAWQAGMPLPEYVRISALLDQPMAIKRSALP
jgi:hypothetical protein